MKVLLRWVGPGYSASRDKETVELSRVPNEGEYIEFVDNRTAEVTRVVHFPEVQGIDAQGDFYNTVEHAACCFVGAGWPT